MDFAAGFAPPLVKAWTTDLGLGEYPEYETLIADGRVFLDATGVDIFALDLATGKQKWKHTLPCCNQQGAYDNGKLFYLSDSGLLTALSAKTGEQLWQVQLTGEWSFPVGPIAANGRVYANGEGSNAITYMLREKDGKLLWQQHLFGAGLLSLGDGGLFVTSSCEYSRLSPADGTSIWTDEECAGGGPDFSAYAEGRLYVPEIPAGNIVDGSDGSLIGSFPYGGTAAMFTFGRKLLGVSQQGDTTLGCWNAKTGQMIWQFTAAFEVQTPPIVVNGVVYVSDALANVYALNPKSGKQIWTDNVVDYGYAPALTAGQGTLVVTNDSKVIAYRSQ